jgi:hypothetical protein
MGVLHYRPQRTAEGRQRSKEGSLGRDAVSPGKAVRALAHLTEGPVFEVRVDQLGGLQAELEELGRRPAGSRIGLGVRRGRFGDDQPTPDSEQWCRALGHHGGASEGPGQGHVESASVALLAPADLGPLLEHTHPGGKSETVHRTA